MLRVKDVDDRLEQLQKIKDDCYAKLTEIRKSEDQLEAQKIVLLAVSTKTDEVEQRAYAEGMAAAKDIKLTEHSESLSDIVDWFIEQDKS